MATDYFSDTATFLDHLKECKRFEYSYPHPMKFEFTARSTIKWEKEDHCHVEYTAPPDKVLSCKFTKDCVDLLTAPEKYRDLKQKKFNLDIKDPANICFQKACNKLAAGQKK
jgi:hypothetical protein